MLKWGFCLNMFCAKVWPRKLLIYLDQICFDISSTRWNFQIHPQMAMRIRICIFPTPFDVNFAQKSSKSVGSLQSSGQIEPTPNECHGQVWWWTAFQRAWGVEVDRVSFFEVQGLVLAKSNQKRFDICKVLFRSCECHGSILRKSGSRVKLIRFEISRRLL